MRNRIMGWIGLLLGGTMVLRLLFGEGIKLSGNSAYVAGQWFGVILSILLLVVGAYYAFQKPRQHEQP